MKQVEAKTSTDDCSLMIIDLDILGRKVEGERGKESDYNLAFLMSERVDVRRKRMMIV
jgi:hypothetical protein